MKSREFSGRSVEEALHHAVQELGVRREKLQIAILRKGKAGIFGLGAEERLEPRAAGGVAGAGLVEEGGALGGRQGEGVGEQGFLGAGVVHDRSRFIRSCEIAEWIGS